MTARAQARSTLERVARAIAEADGGDFDAEPARYRRLAVAALGPLARPTAAMIDAAHEAVWFRRRLGDRQRQRLQEGRAGDDRGGATRARRERPRRTRALAGVRSHTAAWLMNYPG